MLGTKKKRKDVETEKNWLVHWALRMRGVLEQPGSWHTLHWELGMWSEAGG